MKWSEVQQVHAGVAAEVCRTAEQIPAEKWLVARAEGKWSPAEVLEHLILTYEVFTAEIGGGPGMKIKTKWWRRLLWRFTITPRLLRGEPFPPGIRAPREVRPAVTRSQPEAITALRERARKLDEVAAAAQGRGRKVTHPYLGQFNINDGVLFCTRHMQHHLKQIV